MQIRPTTAFQKWLPQPLDRAAILLILGLSVLIGVLLWSGDRTAPRVRNFSWQNKQVGAQDAAFILTFNRPMDQASVESNLRIEPPLPGKTSWAGRRMAYTLDEPAPYGTSFQVQLQEAQDRLSKKASNRSLVKPFLGRFTTRDRAFVYLGVAGADTGRLILYNLTRQQKIALTPPDLIIDEYEPYPEGDRILFSGTERGTQKGLFQEFDPKLYTVSTGIHLNSPDQQQGSQTPAGQIKLMLDNTDYKNYQFDLSPDGQAIVVERLDKRKSAPSSFWLLKPDSPPKVLKIRPGENFTITPDSNSLMIDLGRGLTISPLDPEKISKPIFLPEFGRVLNFAWDGSVAAMVKENSDDSLSLFQISAQGGQKELLRTTGSIYSAQLSPSKQILYCLLTQTRSGVDYQEQHPYLAAINLQSGKLMPLATLTKLAAIDLETGKLANSVNVSSRQDWQISLASDSTALLYAQANSPSQSIESTERNRARNLWLLPVLPVRNLQADTLTQAKPRPEALPLQGFHPVWLP